MTYDCCYQDDVGPLTPRLAARALLGLSVPPVASDQPPAPPSPGTPSSMTSPMTSPMASPMASPLTNNTLLTLALAKVNIIEVYKVSL